MAERQPQNFANHRRIVPLYHVGIFGILAVIPTSRSSAIERFRREVLLSRRVSHPNVVQIFDAVDDPVDDLVYDGFEHVSFAYGGKEPVIDIKAELHRHSGQGLPVVPDQDGLADVGLELQQVLDLLRPFLD